MNENRSGANGALAASRLQPAALCAAGLEPDGDQLKITLKGDLAGMPSAARDSKRSPETGDLLVQGAVVRDINLQPAR